MKLPENYRTAVYAVARGESTLDAMQYVNLVDKICDRTKILAESGKLDSISASEIASTIYGGWYLWLFYWRNRELIWQIANLLATLIFNANLTTKVTYTVKA